MQVKAFELRDRATFVPAVAILLAPSNEAEHYLLRRSGFPCDSPGQRPMILLGGLEGGPFHYDKYDWHGNGTRLTAHEYIEQHWDELESGQVICTEFIRGERTEPKESERTAKL